jgi:SAM-dependent methyltransferase
VPSTTIRRYDGLADWYDSFIRSAGTTAIVLAAAERLLGPGPGTCLDLGCGTGIAFELLTGLGWRVTAVDISEDQVALARRIGDQMGIDVRIADAARLPFETGSFDAVVSLLTHTDFEDAAAAFAEAARVLRPGGSLVYVGSHPCFLSPTVERREGEPHRLHPGYRRGGWWQQAPGFRLGAEGVRGRVGVNHLPLAGFLQVFADAGLHLERVEEPGAEDYPTLIAIRAIRHPESITLWSPQA